MPTALAALSLKQLQHSLLLVSLLTLPISLCSPSAAAQASDVPGDMAKSSPEDSIKIITKTDTTAGQHLTDLALGEASARSCLTAGRSYSNSAWHMTLQTRQFMLPSALWKMCLRSWRQDTSVT